MSQLVTFSRSNNVVTIDLGDHKIMANPDLYVSSKVGSTKVFVSKDLVSGKPVMVLSFEVTDINGRPDDDPTNVAEWLKDTYFYGYTGAVGGGGDWPLDYANSGNQLTNISELQDIEVDIEAGNAIQQGISNKMSSSMVSVPYDNQEIVYLSIGPAAGEIDYVSYKSGVTEVARITMGYDGNGVLITITKT